MVFLQGMSAMPSDAFTTYGVSELRHHSYLIKPLQKLPSNNERAPNMLSQNPNMIYYQPQWFSMVFNGFAGLSAMTTS